jgi:hypothetical protein
MRQITQTVIRLALGVVLASCLCGCGMGMGYGLVLGDGIYYDDPDISIIVYDGLWRGDYVYYRGDWFYRGYGTPYRYYY